MRTPNGRANPKKTNGSGHHPTPRKSYDRFKEFEGRRYTGMAVGRRHNWRYDEGPWVERKLTPEKWEVHFTSVKRRKGRAPEGSGVPVGTEYHWYILADQTARKLDANSYATEMVGHKYKLAHKRADKQTWSASERAQRTALVKILKQMIAELERDTTREPRATKKGPDNAAAARASAVTKRKANAATKHRNGRHLAAA